MLLEKFTRMLFTRLTFPMAVLTLSFMVACSRPTAPVKLGWGEARLYESHREVELGFKSEDGVVLAGTLFLPLEPGDYPALVFHFGSTKWERMTWDQGGPVFWVQNGFAAFSYDKRGVGESQGECCPWRSPGYFPLLGADVVAATREIKSHPDVRDDLVGAWGFSQGGWALPVAASNRFGELAFTIIGSGPVVSLEEELLYSSLTGESDCRDSGMSEENIELQLDQAGVGGFDPVPFLQDMDVPGLWIYGGLDRSVPVARSIRNIEAVVENLGKDFTTVVIPDLNHSMVRNGTICQTDGPGGIDGHVTYDWLAARFDLHR